MQRHQSLYIQCVLFMTKQYHNHLCLALPYPIEMLLKLREVLVITNFQVEMVPINKIIAKSQMAIIEQTAHPPTCFSQITTLLRFLQRVTKETVWAAIFLKSFIINNSNNNSSKLSPMT